MKNYQMANPMKNPFYRFIRFMVWVFYPKMKREGVENLPEEAVVLVGNHAKANGPISSQLFLPRESYTWCVSHMMYVKEVPAYAYEDFWSKKPKAVRWFFKILAYLIAPLAAFIMKNANTIGVYHDKRIIKTFQESVSKLQQGADIVIFPECYDEYNNIVHNFQRGFVDLARMYYKKTGKSMAFVPMYVCPELKKLVFGKPIYYNVEAAPKEEAERICTELMNAVSELAYELPHHRVVTYNNIKKKYYPENVRQYEKEDL